MKILGRKISSLPLFRAVAMVASTALTLNLIAPLQGYAQGTVLNLPVPGAMVSPSPAFVPAFLKGMTINPNDPFRFDFIVDTGHSGLEGDALKKESEKLIKYFLAAVTIPKKDLWVNLSPYEKDRIIPEEFGTTEMGRDLLAQDYLLKQLTASLIYPEDELGKKFWDRVRKRAYEEYGTTDIPMNTFNKVWIVPEKAVVYESGYTAIVLGSHLKVMMEEDYLASGVEHGADREKKSLASGEGLSAKRYPLSADILKELILPELEREVNEGKNFTLLRQIYQSVILATWYKEKLKDSLLNQVYANQKKVAGVDVEDKNIKEEIYDQYLEAYKRGVYNYIKEDFDQDAQQTLPTKYFSGGVGLDAVDHAMTVQSVHTKSSSIDQLAGIGNFVLMETGIRPAEDVFDKTGDGDAAMAGEVGERFLTPGGRDEEGLADLIRQFQSKSPNDPEAFSHLDFLVQTTSSGTVRVYLGRHLGQPVTVYLPTGRAGQDVVWVRRIYDEISGGWVLVTIREIEGTKILRRYRVIPHPQQELAEANISTVAELLPLTSEEGFERLAAQLTHATPNAEGTFVDFEFAAEADRDGNVVMYLGETDGEEIYATLYSGAPWSGGVLVRRVFDAKAEESRITVIRTIEEMTLENSYRIIPHPIEHLAQAGYFTFEGFQLSEDLEEKGILQLRAQLRSSDQDSLGEYGDIAFQTQADDDGNVLFGNLGRLVNNRTRNVSLYTGDASPGLVDISGKYDAGSEEYRIYTSRTVGLETINWTYRFVLEPKSIRGSNPFYTFELVGVKELREQWTNPNPNSPEVSTDLEFETETGLAGQVAINLGSLDGSQVMAYLSTGNKKPGRVVVKRTFDSVARESRITTRRIVDGKPVRTVQRIVPHPNERFAAAGFFVPLQIRRNENFDRIKQHLTSADPFAMGQHPSLDFVVESQNGQIFLYRVNVDGRNHDIKITSKDKRNGPQRIQLFFDAQLGEYLITVTSDIEGNTNRNFYRINSEPIAEGYWGVQWIRDYEQEIEQSQKSFEELENSLNGRDLVRFPLTPLERQIFVRKQLLDEAAERLAWGRAVTIPDPKVYQRFLIESGLWERTVNKIRLGIGLTFHAHERALEQLAGIILASGQDISNEPLRVAALASGPSTLAAALQRLAKTDPAVSELLKSIEITEVDISPLMLSSGAEIQKEQFPEVVIHRSVGNLAALPLGEASHHVSMVAFGINQLSSQSERMAAFAEAHRVTEMNGFVVLLGPAGNFDPSLWIGERLGGRVLVAPKAGDEADLLIIQKTEEQLDWNLLGGLFPEKEETVPANGPSHRSGGDQTARGISDPYANMGRLGSLQVPVREARPWEIEVRGNTTVEKFNAAFRKGVNSIFALLPEDLVHSNRRDPRLRGVNARTLMEYYQGRVLNAGDRQRLVELRKQLIRTQRRFRKEASRLLATLPVAEVKRFDRDFLPRYLDGLIEVIVKILDAQQGDVQNVGSNDAALAASPTGGIDMDSDWLDVETKGEGMPVNWNVSEDFKSYQNAPGFIPLIFQITPLPSLVPFLVEKSEKNDESELSRVR